MTPLFADTFFFIALLVPEDGDHARANAIIDTFASEIVTTTWVLFEVGDALASPKTRATFGKLLDWLDAHPFITVLPSDAEQFLKAAALYRNRPDKAWSLTDCTSFVTMQERGLREALTGDHHFEQAGFIPLLK